MDVKSNYNFVVNSSLEMFVLQCILLRVKMEILKVQLLVHEKAVYLYAGSNKEDVDVTLLQSDIHF